jgi:hypothetical protein
VILFNEVPRPSMSLFCLLPYCFAARLSVTAVSRRQNVREIIAVFGHLSSRPSSSMENTFCTVGCLSVSLHILGQFFCDATAKIERRSPHFLRAVYHT